MNEKGSHEIKCTCPKKECPRYLQCDECRVYHYEKGKKPHCERKKFRLFQKNEAREWEIRMEPFAQKTGCDKEVINGLAVYRIGEGESLLLFPYPHGATITGMADSLLGSMLTGIGRSVITFDPPGAYKSTRGANFTLDEMLECAEEALRYFDIEKPVDVAGHSMGGFCAVAFAVKKSGRVRKLLVICGNPGYAAVRRQWFRSKMMNAWDFLKLTYYGFREIVGAGNMENHKKMNNLLDYHLFQDKAHFVPQEIHQGDAHLPAPARNKWMDTVRKEDYQRDLGCIGSEVLLISGREDILSAEKVNMEMKEQIRNAELVFFDNSRHYPFIEEKEKFIKVVSDFLNDNFKTASD